MERNKKRHAWLQLLEVYRKIDPNSNIDSLKKRINNIRRELKKVEQIQKSGAGAKDVYISNLLYFENLNFLCDQEAQVRGISTMDSEQTELEADQTEESTESETAAPSYSCLETKRKTLGQHMIERNVLLKQALDQLAKKDTQKDEASVYAESWAASYRKLSLTHQIYAKKSIEEILVLGQLNLLSLHSVSSSTTYSASSSASSTPNPSQCFSLPLPPGSGREKHCQEAVEGNIQHFKGNISFLPHQLKKLSFL